MNGDLSTTLEARARDLDGKLDRFRVFEGAPGLVMGTPGFTVAIATYAIISSAFVTSTQTGAEHAAADGVDGGGEGDSLSDLLRLHERATR